MDAGVPLDVNSIADERIRGIVHMAATSWLKTSDVLDILQHYQHYRLAVCTRPPIRPPGMCDGCDFCGTQDLGWFGCGLGAWRLHHHRHITNAGGTLFLFDKRICRYFRCVYDLGAV